MIYKGFLNGNNIKLRSLTLSDCTDRYLGWLNDAEVNQYLETRWMNQSIDTISDFVHSINNSDHSYLFAIIVIDGCKEEHIGNIKIGPIHQHYYFADVSYFIGDKKYWGRGIATEAIKLITRFGFDDLGLNRVQAGVYGNNIGSIKALEKAGFRMEGCLRKQLRCGDRTDDHLYFGILKEEMLSNKA